MAGFESESDTYFSLHVAHPYLTTYIQASFPYCTLVIVTVLVSPQANRSQSEWKKKSLESFFAEKYPMMKQQKTLRQTTDMKVAERKIPRVLLKLWIHCKRLCINMRLSNQAMKASKLLHHTQNKNCALKVKPFLVFQKKNNVNMNRSNYLRSPFHQTYLHRRHHS